MMKEFPSKAWSIASVNRLIKKLPPTVQQNLNPAVVVQSLLEHDRTLSGWVSWSAVKKIIHAVTKDRGKLKEKQVYRGRLRRIVKQDLQLKAYKRVIGQTLNKNCRLKRLQRSQQLLERFPNDRSVRRIWFTDEKTFTVASPVNSQNDRVYSFESKKRQVPKRTLIREREHFSRGIMVSVAVSRMGKTSVVFVEPGAKINSEYYCENVLRQSLLPEIQETCGRHNWTLQQDGAPAHTAKNTINFLHQENVNFIEPNM